MKSQFLGRVVGGGEFKGSLSCNIDTDQCALWFTGGDCGHVVDEEERRQDERKIKIFL